MFVIFNDEFNAGEVSKFNVGVPPTTELDPKETFEELIILLPPSTREPDEIEIPPPTTTLFLK